MRLSYQPQAFPVTKPSLDVWHSRLGHPLIKIVQNVGKALNLKVPMNKNLCVCASCQQGKSHKQPFLISTSLSLHPLDLIHSDVWVLAPLLARNKFRYYVVFIYDFTKYS